MEQLQKLGLSFTEAMVYEALLELGEGQAGKISKKTQINRTTIYDSLERLLKRGLITYVIKSNKKIFQPISPDRLLELIKEQELIAKEILPQLKAKFRKQNEVENSVIYHGRKGIKTILGDILHYQEYIAFGSSSQFLNLMKHDFVQFQKQKKVKKIKAKVILANSARTTESVKIAYSVFRFIPDEFSSLTTTFVYGNYTAIIVWGLTPIATVIKSQLVANSYKNYFQLLWKTAKV